VRRASSDPTLLTTATKNAVRGKGRCFGRAQNEGTCQGMAGTTGPNHPDVHEHVVTAQQPRHEPGPSAKRHPVPPSRLRRDARGALREGAIRAVHATARRPSVSRVPEIGMHGLKGGPALSPMTLIV
jgi:hypothetical protein